MALRASAPRSGYAGHLMHLSTHLKSWMLEVARS